MAKGRTPDATPNKVMNPIAKSVSNEDGSRTLIVPYNDENGNRTEGEITLVVENGVLTMKASVTS
jgi:hypothetical protein